MKTCGLSGRVVVLDTEHERQGRAECRQAKARRDDSEMRRTTFPKLPCNLSTLTATYPPCGINILPHELPFGFSDLPGSTTRNMVSCALPGVLNKLTPQAQTPQQRRANDKYAKQEAAKRGKPQSATKPKEKFKPPISYTWISRYTGPCRTKLC